MKVAIINMSDRVGGAAIAAYRIAQSLEKYYKVNSFYIVRSKSTNTDNVFQTTKNSFYRTIERYFNILMSVLGLQYFFLPFSPPYIRRKLSNEKPNIIHLHNIIGGYFQINDLTKINRVAPIVWTLHDMWAITANAAHTFGDTSFIHLKKAEGENKIYPHIGLNTGNWLIKRKKEIYENTDITIVVPSIWLYNLSKKSPLLKDKEIIHIPHGIDLNLFKAKPKDLVRKKINIPSNAKVIMFAAQSSLFKGGNDLLNILTKIHELLDFELHVLLLGGIMDELKNFNKIKVHHLGYIKDEEKMVEAYSAADIFLYPTRADNLPLVLIENAACGKPAITFNVGGCPEIIKDNENGFVINNFNPNEAAQKTIMLLKDESLLETFSKNARKIAELSFNEKTMADSYFKIYEELNRTRSQNLY